MKYLKKILFISGTFFIFNTCFAQNEAKENYEKFDHAFSSIINYPVELIRNCTPSACLLKVQVDSAENVTDMKLSDSADSLLIMEFKRHKHSLDVKLLENYLKSEYPNNNCKTYLIPLSYGFHQMPCPSPNIKIDLLDNYLKFDGNYVSGNVILLKPIGFLVHIQR